MRWILFAALLAGCGKTKISDPSLAEGVMDCAAVAARGADGAVDDCDLRACSECVSFCGSDCRALEGEPTAWDCPSVGAWTLYDTCPDRAPAAPQEAPGEGAEEAVPGEAVPGEAVPDAAGPEGEDPTGE